MEYITFINQIETKLKIENQQLTSGRKMRLKAVRYYFQLLSKGHAKFKSKLNCRRTFKSWVWFARCVRSWAKAFKTMVMFLKVTVDNILKGTVFLMMKMFNQKYHYTCNNINVTLMLIVFVILFVKKIFLSLV
jgi:hypothetical protein